MKKVTVEMDKIDEAIKHLKIYINDLTTRSISAQKVVKDLERQRKEAIHRFAE
jgi:NADH/NAD ratio-sensing transcriptional regulator Rex